MSGTSLDGVDAVLARFTADGKPEVLARSAQPFPAALRNEFLSLNSSGHDELARGWTAANALAEIYTLAVKETLVSAQLNPADICAIGAHGQTVRHQPALGYTIQLNAPALLAERTGISVIADFRSRDVAAGGQGAPLVPFFHASVFQSGQTRVILNLGGIANITVLRPAHDPIGFDTGPANVLMDLWCQRHTGQSFDQEGRWGASGRVDSALLAFLIESEPWFALPAPKSTGRDLFHEVWLQSRLDQLQKELPSRQPLTGVDTQATLRALTAQTVADAVNTHAPDTAEVLVCGGGARNGVLLEELRARLSRAVALTDTAGIGTQDVEALAFAWLAWAHQQGIPVSSSAVTGASGARILGAFWPA